MQLHRPGMNLSIPHDASTQAVQLQDRPFSQEKILPMAIIREHTKTDDVPTVSDAMLSLYRKTALAQAQKYTKLLLEGKKAVTEDFAPPLTYQGHSRHMHDGRSHYFKFTAKYAFAEDKLYYYGLTNHSTPQIIGVEVGAREARLPRTHDNFGLGCCTNKTDSHTARIMYMAGFGCEDDIPPEIIMGSLKFITHLLENPGDTVVATTNDGANQTRGLGVANAASALVASGALELWRSLRVDAV